MVKISAIVKELEVLAPLELAAEWDNTGWQVKLEDKDVTKVMLALSPGSDIIKQAQKEGCNLVITHHPLVFSKINSIDCENSIQKIIIEAIKNDVHLYCAHTNLDKAPGGVSDVVADVLGLENVVEFEEFVKTGTLKKTKNLDEMVEVIKKVFDIDKLNLINPQNIQKVSKVAVCPGSGGDFIKRLKDVDLYITGDVKYHDALEVMDKIVIDAGHFEIERIILPVLKEKIEQLGVNAVIAEESAPWIVV